MRIKNERKRVICPKCGYRMPLEYSGDAECAGVFVKCKGRNCTHIFELNIEKGQQRIK